MTANRDKLLLVACGVAIAAGYTAIFWALLHDSVIGRVCAGLFAAAIAAIAWRLAGTRDPTFRRKLLMIVLAPVALAGAMFGLIAILLIGLFLTPVMAASAIRQMWKEAQLRRELSKQERLLPLSQLVPRLEAGEGTLLEETGHKGAYRVWWTSDELASIAPNIEAGERFVQLLEGNDVGGFNQLCLESYLGESQGKAILTSIPPRHARSGKLSRQFPKAKCVMVVRLSDS
jgi:hypothetical protein